MLILYRYQSFVVTFFSKLRNYYYCIAHITDSRNRSFINFSSFKFQIERRETRGLFSKRRDDVLRVRRIALRLHVEIEEKKRGKKKKRRREGRKEKWRGRRRNFSATTDIKSRSLRTCDSWFESLWGSGVGGRAIARGFRSTKIIEIRGTISGAEAGGGAREQPRERELPLESGSLARFPRFLSLCQKRMRRGNNDEKPTPEKRRRETRNPWLNAASRVKTCAGGGWNFASDFPSRIIKHAVRLERKKRKREREREKERERERAVAWLIFRAAAILLGIMRPSWNVKSPRRGCRSLTLRPSSRKSQANPWFRVIVALHRRVLNRPRNVDDARERDRGKVQAPINARSGLVHCSSWLASRCGFSQLKFSSREGVILASTNEFVQVLSNCFTNKYGRTSAGTSRTLQRNFN